MWPFRRKPGLLPGPQPVCLHEHWEIRGQNAFGRGQCLDCEKEVPLDILFNALHNRTERILGRVEEKLRGMP